MIRKETHFELKKKKGLSPVSPLLEISPEEKLWLKEWYYWGEALLKGEISPLSSEQGKLVHTFKDHIKPITGPKEYYEKVLVPKFNTSWWTDIGLKSRLILLNFLALRYPVSFLRIFECEDQALLHRKNPNRASASSKEVIKTKKSRKKSKQDFRKNKEDRMLKVKCPSCGSFMFKARIIDGFDECLACTTSQGTELNLENTFYTREHYKTMRNMMKNEMRKNHKG